MLELNAGLQEKVDEERHKLEDIIQKGSEEEDGGANQDLAKWMSCMIL